MSVVDRPLTALRAETRFLGSELWLIFGRRRNWVGLAVLASVPVIIAVAIKASGSQGGGGSLFFDQITHNGLFVALAALMVESQMFLPIAVAAIAADSVAGEANLGTLRYLLTVPVMRTRMLAIKATAIALFALASTLLVAVVGMLAGYALFGGGSMLSASGTAFSFGEGLGRVLLICGYIAVQLCAIGAIGLFVSCLTEQPIGGTIAVLILVIMSGILSTVPHLEWLKPYLFTQHWFGFVDLFRDPIMLSGAVRDGLLNAGAYILVFTSAAWARLSSRDITG